MDVIQFDSMARLIGRGTNRRLALFSVAGAVLGYVTRPLLPDAQAGKRKKKRKKPPAFNAFGCLDVGQPCRGQDALCCSGRCVGPKPKKGKRDKRRCVAHDIGTCLAPPDVCLGEVAPCTTIAGEEGSCYRTTGNGVYCAAQARCNTCTRDPDCADYCGTAAAACIFCDGTCTATGGMNCACPT